MREPTCVCKAVPGGAALGAGHPELVAARPAGEGAGGRAVTTGVREARGGRVGQQDSGCGPFSPLSSTGEFTATWATGGVTLLCGGGGGGGQPRLLGSAELGQALPLGPRDVTVGALVPPP